MFIEQMLKKNAKIKFKAQCKKRCCEKWGKLSIHHNKITVDFTQYFFTPDCVYRKKKRISLSDAND